MRVVKWLLLLLPVLGGAGHAAIIRGVVVEHLTGKPLARTLVTAQPAGGTVGSPLRVYTSTSGGFEFTGLRAGAYIVSAVRKNFAAVQYGQKDFRSAGLAIVLDEVSSTFLNIQLPRLGAISGRVVDENDVGLPEHEVMVYRNQRPPQMLFRVPADDRGAYRIYGLEPGSYLIRTVAREYKEGSYIPTFAKETTTVEDARSVQVDLDQEVSGIDVRPKQGRLYKIAGEVRPGLTTPTGEPVTVHLTMASEMGREEIDSSKAFRFPPQPPGEFELYAEGPGTGSYNCFMLAGYQPLEIKDQDLTDIQMPVPCVRETGITIAEKSGQWINPNTVQLLVRRKDLAGTREAKMLRITTGRVALAPGRWELLLRPPPNYCVVGFTYTGSRSEGRERIHPDGWNEVLTTSGNGSLRFTVSATPGAIHGMVTGASREPVAGAPVYLEGYDPDLGKRVTDLVMALTDSHGQYQFRNLAPGSYRILATFEFQRPDAEAMERAGARVVKVQEAVDMPQDLDLSVLR